MGSSNSGREDNGGDITSSKTECTSCEQNINVDNITEGINSAVLDNTSLCASCGKEGNSDNMNTCNKCKMVKYCNAACKKKHRSKHKKACERRVAELHDEQLFKDPPPNEECPICFQPLPIDASQMAFKSCCGKVVCNGCIYEMYVSEGGLDLCAFCRTPRSKSDEDIIKRVKNLMDKGNAEAFLLLAGYYDSGEKGLSQNYQKACELYLKAGELGCAAAYFNLGIANDQGRGVEVDKKKAKHYYELAAIGGSPQAWYNLGCDEGQAGNQHRSYKHFIIAARIGQQDSLNMVKIGFRTDAITKEEYANTLRAYHERQKEMHSDAREKAKRFMSVL